MPNTLTGKDTPTTDLTTPPPGSDKAPSFDDGQLVTGVPASRADLPDEDPEEGGTPASAL